MPPDALPPDPTPDDPTSDDPTSGDPTPAETGRADTTPAEARRADPTPARAPPFEAVSPEERAHVAALAAAPPEPGTRSAAVVVAGRRRARHRARRRRRTRRVPGRIAVGDAGGTDLVLRALCRRHGRAAVRLRGSGHAHRARPGSSDSSSAPPPRRPEPANGPACAPSWGGVYSLDAAASGLDLDRRIARVQQTRRAGQCVLRRRRQFRTRDRVHRHRRSRGGLPVGGDPVLADRDRLRHRVGRRVGHRRRRPPGRRRAAAAAGPGRSRAPALGLAHAAGRRDRAHRPRPGRADVDAGRPRRPRRRQRTRPWTSPSRPPRPASR